MEGRHYALKTANPATLFSHSLTTTSDGSNGRKTKPANNFYLGSYKLRGTRPFSNAAAKVGIIKRNCYMTLKRTSCFDKLSGTFFSIKG